MTASPERFRPARDPNTEPTRTEFDHLPFFGDKSIPDLTNSEIAETLIKAGLKGAAHTNGRSRNLEILNRHLDKIRKDAGDVAVAKFLRSAHGG